MHNVPSGWVANVRQGAAAPLNAMDRQVVDQTASELELHRVLWLIKFLRAMVLHVLLAVTAILLFFLAGIHDLYPLATDMIQAMRAQAIQNRLDGAVIGSSGFALIASLLFLAMLALLVWAYVSITNVRRNALRFQAILILAICAWGGPAKWDEVRFAFGNLDFLFAVLAAFGGAMTALVVPLSVVYALWRVTRSPEPSSFIATLDPRLAPGFWTYLNKLLDLPRTPLRRLSAATAYALALAGAFLLIASMMYLITAGSTSNKLAALAIACKHPEVLADCVALSFRWARGIPFALLLAVAGVAVSGLLQSTAKRLSGLGVSDVLRRPDDPFLLYLRPFDTDDVILPRPRLPLLSRFMSFRPFPVGVEEELFDVADGYRPLIAVGKPGGSKEMLGGMAYRAYLDNSEWQGYVAEKIRRAERIVIVLKDSDGVRWELAAIIREGATAKTLFLLDPGVKSEDEWQTVANLVVPMLQSAGMAPPGFALQSHPIGFFVRNECVVEIVNDNRTATSYRTAFSHFLAA